MTKDDTTTNMCLVLTTEGDVASARRLAREVLERRVVACATMIPVHSMYHWDGEIEATDEMQLVLKTAPHRLDELRGVIVELHSYDLPEFVVLRADAGDAYAQWVDDTVTERGTSTT
jgi:periplasmic divalent cation tolerance protein